MNPTISTEGCNLKATALNQIAEARQHLQAARAALCNLEGTGYCKHYVGLQKEIDRLQEFQVRLNRLNPPTGVFKP